MERHVRIAYQPALDGVRALAVAAVLLFHAATPGFDGGYLGVSVFFTLSGFLITSLLLREHATTGTIDAGAFYSRRVRRLLPASLLTLGLIVVLSGTTDVFDGVDSLRSHVLGALFQVANWVFLAGGGSYQELLADTGGTPSPIEHFWSLAIEEQFYWVWPLVTLGLLRLATTRRMRIAWFGAITAASIVAAPVIAQVWGPDAAYWATPARLSEILVGAMLAVLIDGRVLDRRLAALAPIALVGLGAAVALFPAASGPAYEGWLPMVAIGSGALLTGLQVDSPLTRAVSLPPLVWIGRVSYGIYLYHWPVYVVVDEERLGRGGSVLTMARLAVTLAVAAASYYLVEQPVRRLRRPKLVPTLGTSAVAMAAVATAAVAIVPGTLGEYWQVDDEVAEAAAITPDERPLALVEPEGTVAPATTVVSAPPTTNAAEEHASSEATSSSTVATSTSAPPPSTLAPLPALERPVRIVVTGDSTGAALGTGLVAWAVAHPELAQVEVKAAAGCGFLGGGERRRGDGVESDAPCDGWVQDQLIPVVERTQPDVVAVMITTWDVIGRRWTTEELVQPWDAEYRAQLLASYGRVVDELLAAGAGRVAFIRQPVPDTWWLPAIPESDQPERHAVVYETYEQLLIDKPDAVSVVPFDRWFSDQNYDRDDTIRPDGIHLDPAAAEQLSDDYLGDRLIRSALGMPVA